MHLVNSCANDIEHTENNKLVYSANYHLNKFLSAPARSSHGILVISAESHCLMTSLLMLCSSHLQGEQLPSNHNKTTYFHMHISISKFVIPLCCRYQVLLSCTCEEYVKKNTILGYFSILQSNHLHQL